MKIFINVVMVHSNFMKGIYFYFVNNIFTFSKFVSFLSITLFIIVAILFLLILASETFFFVFSQHKQRIENYEVTYLIGPHLIESHLKIPTFFVILHSDHELSSVMI